MFDLTLVEPFRSLGGGLCLAREFCRYYPLCQMGPFLIPPRSVITLQIVGSGNPVKVRRTGFAHSPVCFSLGNCRDPVLQIRSSGNVVFTLTTPDDVCKFDPTSGNTLFMNVILSYCSCPFFLSVYDDDCSKILSFAVRRNV